MFTIDEKNLKDLSCTGSVDEALQKLAEEIGTKEIISVATIAVITKNFQVEECNGLLVGDSKSKNPEDYRLLVNFSPQREHGSNKWFSAEI